MKIRRRKTLTLSLFLFLTTSKIRPEVVSHLEEVGGKSSFIEHLRRQGYSSWWLNLRKCQTPQLFMSLLSGLQLWICVTAPRLKKHVFFSKWFSTQDVKCEGVEMYCFSNNNIWIITPCKFASVFRLHIMSWDYGLSFLRHWGKLLQQSCCITFIYPSSALLAFLNVLFWLNILWHQD